jgi:hypothetical protein
MACGQDAFALLQSASDWKRVRDCATGFKAAGCPAMARRKRTLRGGIWCQAFTGAVIGYLLLRHGMVTVPGGALICTTFARCSVRSGSAAHIGQHDELCALAGIAWGGLVATKRRRRGAMTLFHRRAA